VTDLKAELHRNLHAGRAGLLSKLEEALSTDTLANLRPAGTGAAGLGRGRLDLGRRRYVGQAR
jgi:hypothetical protein